jgi:DNA polymerase-3 subunit delta'
MTQHAAPSYLPHAAIIWGGDEEERFRFALNLAAGRVCSAGTGSPCGVCAHCVKAVKGIHPDILIHDHSADSRLFSVAQVRAIREDAVVMPNEAAVKVYVIRHADSMNAAAQNAFLKTLEEPPRSAVFFLLAEAPENLLPTVVSRCAKICVAPGAAPEGGKLAEDFSAALEGGALPLAEFSFRLDKLSRDELRDFISQARALLLARAQQQSASAQRFIRAYDVLGKALEYLDFNVGVVHVSGFICAALLDTPSRA